MIVNKTKPINAVENAGYLNIYYEDDEFHIELYSGVQSFKLDYSNEEYESARWMAKQFAHALNRMVGDVRLYGTEPADATTKETANMENLTELRERLQEDIIWYFACDGGDDGITIAEVLRIIDGCFPESTSSARMPDEALEETAYLLRNPANAKRLIASIEATSYRNKSKNDIT